MDYHYPNLTSSFNSSVQPRRGAAPARGNAFWSTLNPLNLGERIKNGLRGPLRPPDSSTSSRPRSPGGAPTLGHMPEDQQAFSPIGASAGARLCLSKTLPNAPPQTVIWACPQPAWGKWPCQSFEYCISILTESEARALYLLTPSPLPPVYECTLDGVVHLWLVVPSCPSVDGLMRLSEGQLRGAVEFYERTVATCDDGAVLLACAYGHEVDTVGLAVLLLACHFRDYDCGPQHGKDGVGYGGSGSAYHASRLIDDDPSVSYVWKGLLMWQDVERVEAVVRSGVY